MPGGVSSPVRAFKSVGGQPVVFDSVKGSHVWDVDGNEYIDYVGSWGPAIIGHADDQVLCSHLLLLQLHFFYPNFRSFINIVIFLLPSAIIWQSQSDEWGW